MRTTVLAIGLAACLACADAKEGPQGPAGPQGSTGNTGPIGPPGPAARPSVVWKDAKGVVIPVVSSTISLFDTQGTTILYFTDAQGIVWNMQPVTGLIYAAYVTPVFVDGSCSGTPYVQGLAKWAYFVRQPGKGKVIYFKEDAALVKVAPSSRINDQGQCVSVNGSSDSYLSVDDAVVVPDGSIPSKLFALPIRAEVQTQ